MIYGSVCSGIEAATVAWHPLGWRPAFFSEIDPFPRAVLAHHYPEVPLHGDFTTIQAGQYRAIDLLVGGTPCQSFSVAGLRGGLDDDCGNLALEFCRLADRLRPRWVIWENVPGVLSSFSGPEPESDLDIGAGWEATETSDFACFLAGLAECGYGLAYRVLDAQYVRVDGFAGAVPQRRERVFVVGYLGDWRRAAAVLFEPEGMRRDSAPRRSAGAGSAAGTLGGTSPGGGWRFGPDEAAAGQLIPFDTTQITSAANRSAPGPGDPCHPLSASAHAPAVAYSIQAGAIRPELNSGPSGAGVQADVAYTLEARAAMSKVQAVAYGGNDTRGPIEVATAPRAKGGTGHGDFESETFVAAPLGSNGRQDPDVTGDRAGSINTSSPQDQCVMLPSAVRRLTPTECERLQGFPDGYTAVPHRGRPAADGPRYKALGNSMAVNVMRWIGARIDLFEKHVGRAA